MAVYRLSTRAALDLDEIYEYTILNFGLTQAQSYLNGLHEPLKTSHNSQCLVVAPVRLRRIYDVTHTDLTSCSMCRRSRVSSSCASCMRAWMHPGIFMDDDREAWYEIEQ